MLLPSATWLQGFYEQLGPEGFQTTPRPLDEMKTVDKPAFRVQMCDGCCCGTQEKHPDIDHAGQRSALTEAALDGGGTARSVDCLGECHASNVAVVLHPDRPADWLGWIVDDQITSDICAWLKEGAPSPMPALISPHTIERDQADQRQNT